MKNIGTERRAEKYLKKWLAKSLTEALQILACMRRGKSIDAIWMWSSFEKIFRKRTYLSPTIKLFKFILLIKLTLLFWKNIGTSEYCLFSRGPLAVPVAWFSDTRCSNGYGKRITMIDPVFSPKMQFLAKEVLTIEKVVTLYHWAWQLYQPKSLSSINQFSAFRTGIGCHNFFFTETSDWDLFLTKSWKPWKGRHFITATPLVAKFLEQNC